MLRLNSLLPLLNAVIRLSPRMVFFMVRRELRSRLVPRFPAVFRWRIHASAAKFRSIPPKAERASAALQEVSAFYCAEYRAMIDEVQNGVISLNNRTVDFDAPDRIDWNHALPEDGDHQMWRVKLAHMGFLCPMLADGSPELQRLAGELAEHASKHTDMTAPGAFKAFWFPYAASHRVLALGAGLVVARERGTLAPDVDRAVSEFLHINAAFVLNTVEHELCNNHVERNLAALCLYFSYIAHIPYRIARQLERDISYLVQRTVLPDGTQVERSPMYQGLSMVSLGIMAEAPFLSEDLRATLRQYTSASRKAFAFLCHPDGEIALFNDAWHGEVPRLTGAAAPDGRSVLNDGGYSRLSLGGDVCLMDAGPLGPPWNPAHGHSDFLSLELSLEGMRLIVDPGTSRYNTGADRRRERSAAAHNGPAWIGHEPIEFFGSFKVGKLVEAHLIDPKLLPDHTIAGKFYPLPGPVARIVRFWPEQGWLIGDIWFGLRPAQVRWLVPKTWKVKENGGSFWLNHISSKRRARITVLGSCKSMFEPAVCANRYGLLEPAQALTLRPKWISGDTQRLLTWVGHSEAPESAEIDGAALIDILQSQIIPPSTRK